MTFTFSLSKQLQLNGTFHHIFFYLKNLFDCSRGHVSLSNHCNQWRCRGCTNQIVKFSFCGSLSQFTNYFPENRACLKVSAERETKCNVTFSFSIMDKGIMRSLLLPKHAQQNLKWTLSATLAKTTVDMFHVQVSKLDNIVVETTDFEQNSVQLCDGPSHFSPLLTKILDNFYTTSTFQFVAFVWSAQSSDRNTRKQINYSAQLQKGQNISLNTETQTLKYNTRRATARNFVSVSFLCAPPTFNIKVTADTLSETLLPSKECLFGGLAMFENEISTLCQQSEQASVCKNCDNYQSLYTKRNFAAFVVYSYNTHGTFSARLSLSKTHCTPISIHICSLHKTHVNPLFKHFTKEVNRLNSEVELIGRATTKVSGFLFEVSLDKCIVIQINSDLSTWIIKHLGLGTCFVEQLRPKYIPEHQMELQLGISGQLPFRRFRSFTGSKYVLCLLSSANNLVSTIY